MPVISAPPETSSVERCRPCARRSPTAPAESATDSSTGISTRERHRLGGGDAPAASSVTMSWPSTTSVLMTGSRFGCAATLDLLLRGGADDDLHAGADADAGERRQLADLGLDVALAHDARGLGRAETGRRSRRGPGRARAPPRRRARGGERRDGAREKACQDSVRWAHPEDAPGDRLRPEGRRGRFVGRWSPGRGPVGGAARGSEAGRPRSGPGAKRAVHERLEPRERDRQVASARTRGGSGCRDARRSRPARSGRPRPRAGPGRSGPRARRP